MCAKNRSKKKSSFAALLQAETNVDDLLELASKFGRGELKLSHAEEHLLLQLLQEKGQVLLQPGDEFRHLNVSVKKERDGASNISLKMRAG